MSGESTRRQTNKEFANDPNQKVFLESCRLADIRPTKRQASKWRRKVGLARKARRRYVQFDGPRKIGEIKTMLMRVRQIRERARVQAKDLGNIPAVARQERTVMLLWRLLERKNSGKGGDLTRSCITILEERLRAHMAYSADRLQQQLDAEIARYELLK